MIKHIVLFKLAENAEGNPKSVNAQIIKERLEALKGVIPQIVNIEVCIDCAPASANNYDILLDSEFRNFDDLNIYATHPAHLDVVAFISKVRTDRAAVDYEF